MAMMKIVSLIAAVEAQQRAETRADIEAALAVVEDEFDRLEAKVYDLRRDVDRLMEGP